MSCSLFRQFCLELNGLAVKLQVSQILPPSANTPPSAWWSYPLLPSPLFQSECHPDTCTQMTATEQWIFLCAAHKTPKEARATCCGTAVFSPDPNPNTWQKREVTCVFCCFANSALPLITPGTRWMELPAF